MEEFIVSFPIVLLHIEKFALYLLFDIGFDELQSAVSGLLWASVDTVPTADMADDWWLQWVSVFEQFGVKAGSWEVLEDELDEVN